MTPFIAHCQGDKDPEHTQGRQVQPSHLQAHQMLEQEDWTGALKTLPHPFGQSSKSDAFKLTELDKRPVVRPHPRSLHAP